jgi:hypothetical protein
MYLATNDFEPRNEDECELATDDVVAVIIVASVFCLTAARPKGRGFGQPRVVAAVTGGGGHLFAYMLSEPGGSSTLLEGLVPYDKQSCLGLLGSQGRDADGIQFCASLPHRHLGTSALTREVLGFSPFAALIVGTSADQS